MVFLYKGRELMKLLSKYGRIITAFIVVYILLVASDYVRYKMFDWKENGVYTLFIVLVCLFVNWALNNKDKENKKSV